MPPLPHTMAVDGPSISQITSWLSRLVRTPSVTPAQGRGATAEVGEGRLAEQVAQWFPAFGGEVHREEVLPGRPNVYGLWRGQSSRWMAIDVHMDTVGVSQMTGEPFSGIVQDGRVYGRGAVDTKASLAAALAILERMHETGAQPTDNLLIAATVDEEAGATGAPALRDWLRARDMQIDQMLVAEPTLCQPVHAHKGVLRMRIEIEGETAHSSQPHLGRNAIAAAAEVIQALKQEHDRLQQIEPTTELGRPTLTVTTVEGGEGENIVPSRCSIGIDYRITPEQELAAVREHLQRLIERSSALPVTFHEGMAIPAFYEPVDSPWIQSLATWSGQAPITVPFGTNAWAYAAADGPVNSCAVVGPGSIEQAHAAEEWVELTQLERFAAMLMKWWRPTAQDT